jgi:hypothetical protein
MQEYIESMLSVINSTSVSDWDKRIGAHAFKSKMKMEIPKEFRQWTRSHVSLAEEGETGPKTFTMRYFGSAEHVVKIPVERGTRLVLKDDPRPLSGFDLNSGDLVVLPVKGADIKPEIDAFIASKQLTGIPMVGISTLDFNAKSVRGRSGGANKKYTARMFRLVSTSHRRALSENWAIEDREPQDTDVFVVMESFIPADVPSFYTSYASDKALVAEMGLVMPEVYGYKSTQDKPVRAVNCKGIAYEDWRKSYILGNMTERYKKLVAAHGFTKLANWGYKLVKAGLLQELEKNLGMCHPVTELYRDYQESWALREKASLLETELAGKVYLMLYPRWDTKGPEQIRAQQVWSKYPLISGFDCFDENDMWKHYFHYIHLIDKE